MQRCVQDAHEFLNYLLNECSELLEKDQKQRLQGSTKPLPDPLPLTWIQNLFQVSVLSLPSCIFH